MRRLYFTLLEVLIALAILALVGSFTAFSMYRAYQDQRALGEMSQVVQLFNTATDLMMLMNLDSEIKVSKKDEKMQVELIPKSGVSRLAKSLIPEAPLVFEYIEEITFKDAYQATVLQDSFPLVMLSKGFLMNRGVLTMKSGNLQGSIILYGYPASSSLIKGMPDYPEEKSLQDLIYQVTEQTRMETEKA